MKLLLGSTRQAHNTQKRSSRNDRTVGYLLNDVIVTQEVTETARAAKFNAARRSVLALAMMTRTALVLRTNTAGLVDLFIYCIRRIRTVRSTRLQIYNEHIKQ